LLHNDLATGPARRPLKCLPFVCCSRRNRCHVGESPAHSTGQVGRIVDAVAVKHIAGLPAAQFHCFGLWHAAWEVARCDAAESTDEPDPPRPATAHGLPHTFRTAPTLRHSPSRKMALGRPTRTPCAQEDGVGQATAADDSPPPDSCFALVTPTISQAKARENASSAHRFIFGCAEKPRPSTRRSRDSWICSIRSFRCPVIDSSSRVFTGSTLQYRGSSRAWLRRRPRWGFHSERGPSSWNAICLRLACHVPK
jgi:hypothetical protein